MAPTPLPLAPRIGIKEFPSIPAPQVLPTRDEWASFYPELERLYVRERRKLRYVMMYMERKHGFKASSQMFKIRFSKWGFQKNSRRSDISVRNIKAELDSNHRSDLGVKTRSPSPANLSLGIDDSLMLLLLSNIRACNSAFFETIQPPVCCLAVPSPIDRELLNHATDVNLVFKLVTDLLDRGHGETAGRMARKAFLLLEEMLALDVPALLWNLLEIMHHMVSVQHAHLFQMVLAHVIALENGRNSKARPLTLILQGLRDFTLHLTKATSTQGDSSPPSPSSSSSTSGSSDSAASNGRWHPSGRIAFLLERAWSLNTEMVFHHFNPCLFSIYSRLHWDSCSINPPFAIFGVKDQWLREIKQHEISSSCEQNFCMKLYAKMNPIDDDKMSLQSSSLKTESVQLGDDIKSLRDSSFAELMQYGDSILGEGASYDGNTATLLPLLVGLLKYTMLEEQQKAATAVASDQFDLAACSIRTVMNLSLEQRGDAYWSYPDTISQIRSIITLRELAGGKLRPNVLREMWALERALKEAGRFEEAQAIKKSAIARAEEYIQDIPAGSV
ncbi:hypothetical protein B0A52_07921 [Exophiala mesophila]|uniref:Clr5 domain-containing protein n=1 Tax=Exophiala mesophila TaxID=212818 RepID=A0A438MZ80_EXOME|nr:hypothetical protein B0A52_07921 [Exophiala mesophila]